MKSMPLKKKKRTKDEEERYTMAQYGRFKYIYYCNNILCKFYATFVTRKGMIKMNGDKKWNEISKMEIPYWYPKTPLSYTKANPFLKSEKWSSVDELFTKRALIVLSVLFHEIEEL